MLITICIDTLKNEIFTMHFCLLKFAKQNLWELVYFLCIAKRIVEIKSIHWDERKKNYVTRLYN